MRLIAVLVTLLIVGLLVQKQLGGDNAEYPDSALESSREGTPRVPTNPGQLPAFEKQLNEFVDDEAARRASEMEAAGTH